VKLLESLEICEIEYAFFRLGTLLIDVLSQPIDCLLRCWLDASMVDHRLRVFNLVKQNPMRCHVFVFILSEGHPVENGYKISVSQNITVDMDVAELSEGTH
jgi:hypothetical protein